MELTSTVVGVIDDSDSAQAAADRLAAAGFTADLLSGEAGIRALDENDEGGVFALLRRLVLTFGDESRILDRLESVIRAGSVVLVVRVEEDAAPKVSSILSEHGGHDLWRLGEWSFNRLGPDEAGSDEEEHQDGR